MTPAFTPRVSPSPGSVPPPARRLQSFFFVILFAAGAWRFALASAMPTLARDGVGYCWNARDLGRRGAAALRGPEFNQHPLYALTILGAQRVLLQAGFPDAPLTWQRAGQTVSFVSGLAVVVLAGVLARRLVTYAEPERLTNARHAGLWAMALAALLPLNTWLSADVMAEQLFLVAYLGGVALLLKLDTPRVALATGLLTGLAFLTRPEGAAVGLGAAAVLLGRVGRESLKRLSVLALALVLGFLTLAAPYWWLLGGFSPKANKETMEEFRAWRGLEFTPLQVCMERRFFDQGRDRQGAEAAEKPAVFRAPPLPDGRGSEKFARLLRQDTAWYLAAPRAAYETLRGGRVVVPLLALPVLIVWRKQFLRGPLRGWLTCGAAHFALITFLVHRHGYLDPRHTLPVAMLLVPFAGIFLAYALPRIFQRRWWALLVLLPAMSLGTLAYYSTRIPQGPDEYIRWAADGLRRDAAANPAVRLLGGSSERRIAFYADVRWAEWPEDEASLERRWAALRAHVLNETARPDYFAITTGPDRERELADNAELLDRLKRDEQIGAAIQSIRVEHAPHGVAVHLLRFAWPPK